MFSIRSHGDIMTVMQHLFSRLQPDE